MFKPDDAVNEDETNHASDSWECNKQCFGQSRLKHIVEIISLVETDICHDGFLELLDFQKNTIFYANLKNSFFRKMGCMIDGTKNGPC